MAHHLKDCPANDGFGCRCEDMANGRKSQTATPFTQFWDALNANLHVQCLPELTYGMARDLWTEATRQATIEARMIQKRRNRYIAAFNRRTDEVNALMARDSIIPMWHE